MTYKVTFLLQLYILKGQTNSKTMVMKRMKKAGLETAINQFKETVGQKVEEEVKITIIPWE